MGEELSLLNPTLSPNDHAPSLQDSSYLSRKAGPSRELGDEFDLSFLPDELSTQEEPCCHDNPGILKASFDILLSCLGSHTHPSGWEPCEVTCLCVCGGG